jgi:hypothetical protein
MYKKVLLYALKISWSILMTIDIRKFDPNSSLVAGLAYDVAPAAGMVVTYAVANKVWSVLDGPGKNEQTEPLYLAPDEEQQDVSPHYGDVYASAVGASRPITTEAKQPDAKPEFTGDGLGLAIMAGSLALLVGLGAINGIDKIKTWAKRS